MKFCLEHKWDLLFWGTATTKQKWKENSVSNLKCIVDINISQKIVWVSWNTRFNDISLTDTELNQNKCESKIQTKNTTCTSVQRKELNRRLGLSISRF